MRLSAVFLLFGASGASKSSNADLYGCGCGVPTCRCVTELSGGFLGPFKRSTFDWKYVVADKPQVAVSMPEEREAGQRCLSTLQSCSVKLWGTLAASGWCPRGAQSIERNLLSQWLLGCNVCISDRVLRKVLDKLFRVVLLFKISS